MINSEIIIEPTWVKSKECDSPSQYQEWITRFCFAASKLPPTTVEHVISLLETCGETYGADAEQ